MAGPNDIAAGGRPPAAFDPARWVEWRERADQPLYAVALWPNRSLTPPARRSFYAFVIAGLALPLVALAGTAAFWGLLPFLAGTLALIWLGLRRNDRDGRLTEEVTLWRDELRVERREPSGRCLRWAAEPHRVRLAMSDEPVESYLTLKGGSRDIELGRFLSPPERVALADELKAALTRALRA